MKNKGFTLVELLVVIAIIGILSSVVFASLNSARVKSRTAAAQSVLKGLQPVLNLCISNDTAINIGTTDDQASWTSIAVCTGQPNYPALPDGYVYCNGGASAANTACNSTMSSQSAGDYYSISIASLGDTKKCTAVESSTIPTKVTCN